uniref:ATP-dependent Clp protease proteolytic subunit n=1 Tax=Silene chalcedonica TaxID=39855 RepID=V9PEL6_SILCH|nr:clp protease proteolytic subunit [Silene chalcedonica]AGZ18093.1 clp protease proteolytic subunit [Silene chalcedonica]
MPISVPKISFLTKEGQKTKRLDFRYELHKRRLLFLCQDLNSEVVNQITSLLLFLHLEDEDKQQHLFIHSRGGLATHAMAIYDTMQLVTLGVHTIGMGVVASMATLLLAGGAYTKRNAYAHATIMLHHSDCPPYFEGTEAGISVDFKERFRVFDMIAEILEERTGHSYEDLQKVTTAKEAQDYGIIDAIVDKAREMKL